MEVSRRSHHSRQPKSRQASVQMGGSCTASSAFSTVGRRAAGSRVRAAFRRSAEPIRSSSRFPFFTVLEESPPTIPKISPSLGNTKSCFPERYGQCGYFVPQRVSLLNHIFEHVGVGKIKRLIRMSRVRQSHVAASGGKGHFITRGSK